MFPKCVNVVDKKNIFKEMDVEKLRFVCVEGIIYRHVTEFGLVAKYYIYIFISIHLCFTNGGNGGYSTYAQL